MIQNKTYFIFDFDGVIVDSGNIKGEAFAEIYQPYGQKVIEAVLAYHQQHAGQTRIEKFKHCHERILNIAISEKELKELSERFSEITLERIISAPYIDGILEFFEYLERRRKKKFLLSAAPIGEIHKILNARGLHAKFLSVEGAPLAKIENMKRLLTKFAIEPAAAICFGDAEEDRKTAEKFNIEFVPINYYQKDIGFSDFKQLMRFYNLT